VRKIDKQMLADLPAGSPADGVADKVITDLSAAADR